MWRNPTDLMLLRLGIIEQFGYAKASRRNLMTTHLSFSTTGTPAIVGNRRVTNATPNVSMITVLQRRSLASGTVKEESPSQLQVMGKTKSGKQLNIRRPPVFDNREDERLHRKQHLAAAFRVFADRGFDEGVAGHISVRDPILTDHFCMYVPFFCLPMLVWR
jgi:hypothetical protein